MNERIENNLEISQGKVESFSHAEHPDVMQETRQAFEAQKQDLLELIAKGEERKEESFNYNSPAPIPTINHFICDFDYTPGQVLIGRLERDEMERRLQDKTITLKDAQRLAAYNGSGYRLNNLDAILGAFAIFSEDFLEGERQASYAARVAQLNKVIEEIRRKNADVPDWLVADFQRLLLDARKDFAK